MPLSSMSAITPLSKAWTHEDVCSQAMVLTHTIDNEQVQLDNVRHFNNSSIAYLANLLNLASTPWYGIWISGTLDGVHETGLNYIDLSTAINGFVAANSLHSIKRVNLRGTVAIGSKDWIGNARKYDLAEITQLNSMQNTQHRFDVGWTHSGSDLLIFTGSQVNAPSFAPSTPDYDVSAQKFILIAYRKPLLDDLLAPNNAATNYRTNIDMPDEYLDLLVKLNMRQILSVLNAQVPTQLDQDINAGVQTLTTMIDKEMEYEKAEREKLRYGIPQKPVGAI